VGKGDYAAVRNLVACTFKIELLKSVRQKLAKLLTRPLPWTSDSPKPEGPPEISDKVDSLIILDRRVDMITPLLTQLTYEGLVDELFGIKNCK
jgi:hypothetical protein